MTTALTFLILISPVAVAVALSWAAHRTGSLRLRLLTDDRDAFRIDHDVDAVRTRFERQPSWPSSGSLNEGR